MGKKIRHVTFSFLQLPFSLSVDRSRVACFLGLLLTQSGHSSELGLLFGPGAHLLCSGNWPGRWLADSAHSVVFSKD